MKRIFLSLATLLTVLAVTCCSGTRGTQIVETPQQTTHEDQACIDLVFGHTDSTGDDAKPLQERINRQHGLHILDHAEALGLGSKKYQLVKID